MMPVAGQNTVLDAAAFQGKTHNRGTVVEREDVAFCVHEQDRPVTAVHNKSALGFQLLKSTGTHKIRGRMIHRRVSTRGSMIRQRPPRNVNSISFDPIDRPNARVTTT